MSVRDLKSQAPLDWALALSIAEASQDSREAPWYGPWNMILHYLFQGVPPDKGWFTVTYPQFPVDKYIDTAEEESDEDQAGLYALLLIKYLLINSISQAKGFRRSAAPSPEVLKQYPGPPQTPPKFPSPIRVPAPPRQMRSTRIPDFAQLLFKMTVNLPGHTVDIPLRYLVGPLLLVGIKRADRSCQFFDFTEVFEQTIHQARHAFASFPKVNIIGVITALGDCWTYGEYDRRNFSPSPTRSEYSDPTFVDSSPNTPAWPNNPGIDFGDLGFARIQEPPSDRALHAVRERMKVLSALL